MSLHFGVTVDLVVVNLVYVIFNLQSISVSELAIGTKLLQVENMRDEIDCYQNGNFVLKKKKRKQGGSIKAHIIH